MGELSEIDLLGIIDGATQMIRAMGHDETVHLNWMLPAPVEATDRDAQLMQQCLRERFPEWTIEVHRITACGPV